MAQKHTDPCTFLKSVVSKKGKSDHQGVYLAAVTVSADAKENYFFEGDQEKAAPTEVERALQSSRAEWNQLLVDLRWSDETPAHAITFFRHSEPISILFILEGVELQALIMVPTMNVPDFPTEVLFYQHLVRKVAEFAGMTPTSIRFTIGIATIDWDDLVEQGCAREVDVGF